MAKRLKDAGLVELGALRKRVNRQRALGRIQEDDAELLVDYMDEIEAIIHRMWEAGSNGERREF